jgi:hypothetical protein
MALLVYYVVVPFDFFFLKEERTSWLQLFHEVSCMVITNCLLFTTLLAIIVSRFTYLCGSDHIDYSFNNFSLRLCSDLLSFA